MFILQTDALDSGLSYMFSHINEDGEENPVAFGSWKLLPQERALTIVSGILHFCTYLEGPK